ncbi:MAG TPA: AtpZ/AtpI family protein [Bryobacteraceae bacterium]|nr:AtpZ/AtpI family protein [Bryobacteraceae bacterium]
MPKKSFSVMVGEYTSLAFLLPTATFVGYVIGYLLDKAFGTHFLYIVFLLLGIASGFVQLVRQLQRDTRNNGS